MSNKKKKRGFWLGVGLAIFFIMMAYLTARNFSDGLYDAYEQLGLHAAPKAL